MNRRRHFWLALPITLIGSAIAAWFWMSQRDADFVVVGPRTKGVRANFAFLETTIDPADYRDCKTVRQAIARLNERRYPDVPLFGNELKFNPWLFRHHWIRAEPSVVARIALGSPFELPAAPKPITVKQFIRIAYAQSGLPDAAFIVRVHCIDVTTAKQAQEERARYFDSASVYDRVQSFWKEMTGTVEPDGPEPFIVESD